MSGQGQQRHRLAAGQPEGAAPTRAGVGGLGFRV